MAHVHASAAGVYRTLLVGVFLLTLAIFAIELLGGLASKDVDLESVRTHIVEAPGVIDVHDLHAWTITSGMNVVSAHVVLKPGAEAPAVLDALCRCLSGDFDIEHSRFQLETADRRRLEEAGHR